MAVKKKSKRVKKNSKKKVTKRMGGGSMNAVSPRKAMGMGMMDGGKVKKRAGGGSRKKRAGGRVR